MIRLYPGGPWQVSDSQTASAAEAYDAEKGLSRASASAIIDDDEGTGTKNKHESTRNHALSDRDFSSATFEEKIDKKHDRKKDKESGEGFENNNKSKSDGGAQKNDRKKGENSFLTHPLEATLNSVRKTVSKAGNAFDTGVRNAVSLASDVLNKKSVATGEYVKNNIKSTAKYAEDLTDIHKDLPDQTFRLMTHLDERKESRAVKSQEKSSSNEDQNKKSNNLHLKSRSSEKKDDTKEKEGRGKKIDINDSASYEEDNKKLGLSRIWADKSSLDSQKDDFKKTGNQDKSQNGSDERSRSDKKEYRDESHDRKRNESTQESTNKDDSKSRAENQNPEKAPEKNGGEGKIKKNSHEGVESNEKDRSAKKAGQKEEKSPARANVNHDETSREDDAKTSKSRNSESKADEVLNKIVNMKSIPEKAKAVVEAITKNKSTSKSRQRRDVSDLRTNEGVRINQTDSPTRHDNEIIKSEINQPHKSVLRTILRKIPKARASTIDQGNQTKVSRRRIIRKIVRHNVTVISQDSFNSSTSKPIAMTTESRDVIKHNITGKLDDIQREPASVKTLKNLLLEANKTSIVPAKIVGCSDKQSNSKLSILQQISATVNALMSGSSKAVLALWVINPANSSKSISKNDTSALKNEIFAKTTVYAAQTSSKPYVADMGTTVHLDIRSSSIGVIYKTTLNYDTKQMTISSTKRPYDIKNITSTIKYPTTMMTNKTTTPTSTLSRSTTSEPTTTSLPATTKSSTSIPTTRRSTTSVPSTTKPNVSTTIKSRTLIPTTSELTTSASSTTKSTESTILKSETIPDSRRSTASTPNKIESKTPSTTKSSLSFPTASELTTPVPSTTKSTASTIIRSKTSIPETRRSTASTIASTKNSTKSSTNRSTTSIPTTSNLTNKPVAGHHQSTKIPLSFESKKSDGKTPSVIKSKLSTSTMYSTPRSSFSSTKKKSSNSNKPNDKATFKVTTTIKPSSYFSHSPDKHESTKASRQKYQSQSSTAKQTSSSAKTSVSNKPNLDRKMSNPTNLTTSKKISGNIKKNDLKAFDPIEKSRSQNSSSTRIYIDGQKTSPIPKSNGTNRSTTTRKSNKTIPQKQEIKRSFHTTKVLNSQKQPSTIRDSTKIEDRSTKKPITFKRNNVSTSTIKPNLLRTTKLVSVQKRTNRPSSGSISDIKTLKQISRDNDNYSSKSTTETAHLSTHRPIRKNNSINDVHQITNADKQSGMDRQSKIESNKTTFPPTEKKTQQKNEYTMEAAGTSAPTSKHNLDETKQSGINKTSTTFRPNPVIIKSTSKIDLKTSRQPYLKKVEDVTRKSIEIKRKTKIPTTMSDKVLMRTSSHPEQVSSSTTRTVKYNPILTHSERPQNHSNSGKKKSITDAPEKKDKEIVIEKETKIIKLSTPSGKSRDSKISDATHDENIVTVESVKATTTIQPHKSTWFPRIKSIFPLSNKFSSSLKYDLSSN